MNHQPNSQYDSASFPYHFNQKKKKKNLIEAKWRGKKGKALTVHEVTNGMKSSRRSVQEGDEIRDHAAISTVGARFRHGYLSTYEDTMLQTRLAFAISLQIYGAYKQFQ